MSNFSLSHKMISIYLIFKHSFLENLHNLAKIVSKSSVADLLYVVKVEIVQEIKMDFMIAKVEKLTYLYFIITAHGKLIRLTSKDVVKQ